MCREKSQNILQCYSSFILTTYANNWIQLHNEIFGKSYLATKFKVQTMHHRDSYIVNGYLFNTHNSLFFVYVIFGVQPIVGVVLLTSDA